MLLRMNGGRSRRLLVLWTVGASLAGACARRGGGQTEARELPARPLTAAEDPVNKLVGATTVDGLVVVVTIDGATVHLDAATPARLPAAGAAAGGGARVIAKGFTKGALVSQVDVPDLVLNVQEGVGPVRLTKRQIVLPMPASRALDTVEVSAPATAATARLDVRAAYDAYCKAIKDDKKDERICPTR